MTRSVLRSYSVCVCVCVCVCVSTGVTCDNTTHHYSLDCLHPPSPKIKYCLTKRLLAEIYALT